MGRKLQVFVQIRDTIEEDRRLANLVWRNPGNTQERRQFISIDKGEHIKSRLAMVDGTGNGIHMGEDEIDRLLREIIERFALRDNIAE